MNIGRETQLGALGGEEAHLGVGDRVVAHAASADLAVAALVFLHPNEHHRARLEPPALDDLNVGANGDVRPGAPQQQCTIVGGQGRDRQLHDLFERAGAVMVINGAVDFAAVASPCLPRPGRIGVDHAETLAGCGERGEIIDGAAVLDNLGVPRLRLFDLLGL
jgi:hypothetical protein